MPGITDIISVRDHMNRLGRNGNRFFFIIDFDLQKPVLIEDRKFNSPDVLFNIRGYTNYITSSVNKPLEFIGHPVTYSKYLKAFNRIIDELQAGNSYLVNLTFPTKISTNFSLEELFQYSVAPYKLLYKNSFLVFSPECFVRITKGSIYTYPMKGTIDASIKDAGEILLSDKKESAEHATIVDLLRNDLSIVATNVKVNRFRYLEKIKTSSKSLLQMSSEISGKLPANYQENLGNIVFSLLPAGSISGAPKKKTLEIIRKVEDYDRNYYTGVFGYFDGENLDSAVMIRFIENTKNGLVYKSGGGITASSDPEKEYRELIDKVYVPID